MTDYKEEARRRRANDRIAAFVANHVRVSADQSDGLTSAELYERFKSVGGDLAGRRGNVVAVLLRKAVSRLPGVTQDSSMVLWGVRLPVVGSLAWSERTTD